MNTDLEFIVKRLVVELMNRSFTIATAEECTCGLIGASIASQEYPQRWYKGSVTAYSKEAINKLLSVPLYVIDKNGLISSQVAQQMALEILYKFKCNVSIGVVGSVDGYGNDVQICVAKKYNNDMSFAYKKLTVEGKEKGKDIEIIIKEALSLALEHIIS